MVPSHYLLLLATLLMLPGCHARQAAEFLLVRHHFDLFQDVRYGGDPRQRLDVYRPERVRHASPVIVFLYGGRWQHGSKREYRLLGDAITRQGFVAVVPDYRLYPQVSFPGWIDDAAGAVRWVRDSIERFGGDPSQIVVVGHSSGAHTAALLALDERYLREAGLAANVLRGVVSLAGPVATQWTDADVQALMGAREQWSATYPLEHIEGTEPPLLLLHGVRDKVVSSENSTRLAARIRDQGGCSRAVVYRGLDHLGIIVALAVPRLDIAPIMDEVTRFIRHPRAVC